jgi:hypothetical protein
VVTSDVHNFVAAFSQWTPADTTCPSLGGYLKAGSRGLKAYRDKMDMGPADLCRAVRRDPKRYAALRSKLPGIDSAQQAIEGAFAKFGALSPGATLPSVYFVVGDEMSGGTTTRGSAPIVLVGAELLAELTTGHIAASSGDAYGDAHEPEIWRDFKHDMHSKDYSQWIYDGWNRKALDNRPVDLGYYVGYRITKAYYNKLADKRKAVRDILSIRDFDDFLVRSGHSGDAQSQQ